MKFLIADDHKILREGLTEMLKKHHGMEVVAEAPNGEAAVALARRTRPDIAVIDLMMPNMNGFEATRVLKSEFPKIKVIALSMSAKPNYLVEIFKCGADAFLLKDCAFDELMEAISCVSQNKRYISQCLLGLMSEIFIDSIFHSPSKKETDISGRELEVLCLLADGMTNKEAAAKLLISVNTVACHRQSIMKKLALKNAAELTKYAIRNGYVSA